MEENEMKKCEKLLLNFIKTGQINKISDLITYDFHKIRENKLKKFDNGKTYEDGDCTKLAYAIYSIIWLPRMAELGISQFSESNFGNYLNSFSGDTINTLYTTIGSPKYCTRIKKILNLTSAEKVIVNEFEQKYQTIGNFYFLPKNTIKRESINMYRGKKWNDFFDIFLKVLECTFSNKELVDEQFRNLFEKNSFFFDKIHNINDFMNLFFLADTQENYNYMTDFVLKGSGCHYSHSMLCESNVDEYKSFVLDYMSKANVLILKRSKVMVRELLQNLNNTDFPREYLT